MSVSTTTTDYTGMIQLDVSSLLSLATSSGAYVTIGSLQKSSGDVAVFSGSNSLGDLGTSVGNALPANNSGTDQSETFALAQLTDPTTNQYYKYLNVSVQGPGESVLLSSLTLSFNPTGNGPSAAPVPATAGLTLAGALGMGLMLVARRRRAAL